MPHLALKTTLKTKPYTASMTSGTANDQRIPGDGPLYDATDVAPGELADEDAMPVHVETSATGEVVSRA